MKIELPFTQNTSIFVLNLDENMTRSGPQYWYLLTTNYTGFEPTIYTPSENIIAFIQVEGEIQLSVLFSIPQNATIKQKGDITFRFIKTDQKLIQVKVDGGATVGSLTHDISDSAIENYINTAEQKINLIPNGQIDKSFEPLVTSILAKADKIYKIGLPEEATKILDAITPTLFPPPPDTTRHHPPNSPHSHRNTARNSHRSKHNHVHEAQHPSPTQHNNHRRNPRRTRKPRSNSRKIRRIPSQPTKENQG